LNGFFHGFKIWPIRAEKAALEGFLSWPNCIFAAIWNVISAFKQFFPIATETTIVIKPAFLIPGSSEPFVECGTNDP